MTESEPIALSDCEVDWLIDDAARYAHAMQRIASARSFRVVPIDDGVRSPL